MLGLCRGQDLPEQESRGGPEEAAGREEEAGPADAGTRQQPEGGLRKSRGAGGASTQTSRLIFTQFHECTDIFSFLFLIRTSSSKLVREAERKGRIWRIAHQHWDVDFTSFTPY